MYQPKNYEELIGMEGFSEELLRNHFTLYQGYVANTNNIAQNVDLLKAGTAEFAEPRRRFGWEFDGMRLHEFYFENMMKGGSKLDEKNPLYQKISEDFGSFDVWEKDFKAVGAMRGIGWVILYYDKQEKRLFNVWINEHDSGHLAGCEPLLVMDVFEHAYMIQYGTKKADYIEAFMKNICWHVVAGRYNLVTNE